MVTYIDCTRIGTWDLFWAKPVSQILGCQATSLDYKLINCANTKACYNTKGKDKIQDKDFYINYYAFSSSRYDFLFFVLQLGVTNTFSLA